MSTIVNMFTQYKDWNDSFVILYVNGILYKKRRYVVILIKILFNKTVYKRVDLCVPFIRILSCALRSCLDFPCYRWKR